MNVNDAILDALTGHSVGLQRLSNATLRKIIALLNRSDARLIERLARDDVTAISRARQEQLLADVRQIVQGLYADATGQLKADLDALAEYEGKYQGDMLRAVVPVQLEWVAPSPFQLIAATNARPFQGRLMKDWFTDLPEEAFKRLRNTIRAGIVEGRTTEQIIREIRGTRAQGYADGIAEINRRAVGVTVRTAIAHTANAARDEMYQANAKYLKGVQWVSTLDARTSAVCFPGGTQVTPVGNVLQAFKRWYVGEVVVITTSAGNEVSATPNHPILTARGWLPINEVEPGDKVINACPHKIADVAVQNDVKMQADIGAIYDAVSKPPVAHVSRRCSSQADFHGDGMGPHNEVDIATLKGNLRRGNEASPDKGIMDVLFCGVHLAAFLPGDSDVMDGFVGRAIAIEPAQINPGAAQYLVEPRFGPAAAQKAVDFAGPRALVVEADSFGTIGDDISVTNPARQGSHDAMMLEERGDGRDGRAILAGDGASGLPAGVLLDDVVSVRREGVACHVYNLHTDTGYYIAGGMIVKNCRARDGTVYPLGVGPRPPAHPSCRSVITPVLKSLRELGIKGNELKPSTRASMDGQVAQDLSYDGWLRTKPQAFQDDVLGKKKAELFRAGLTLDRFVSRAGDELTLDELKQREAGLWAKAFAD